VTKKGREGLKKLYQKNGNFYRGEKREFCVSWRDGGKKKGQIPSMKKVTTRRVIGEKVAGTGGSGLNLAVKRKERDAC